MKMYFHSISQKFDNIDHFPNIILPKIASDIPNYFSSTITPPIIPIEVASDLQLHPLPINDHSLIPTNPRRSFRLSNPSSYLKDFHCNLLTNSHQAFDKSPYPLSN